MEVEFPAVPGEDASYKAASDVYIDLNIQYALTVFSKIYKETGKTCEVLVPDGLGVSTRQEGLRQLPRALRRVHPQHPRRQKDGEREQFLRQRVGR